MDNCKWRNLIGPFRWQQHSFLFPISIHLHLRSNYSCNTVVWGLALSPHSMKVLGSILRWGGLFSVDVSMFSTCLHGVFLSAAPVSHTIKKIYCRFIQGQHPQPNALMKFWNWSSGTAQWLPTARCKRRTDFTVHHHVLYMWSVTCLHAQATTKTFLNGHPDRMDVENEQTADHTNRLSRNKLALRSD